MTDSHHEPTEEGLNAKYEIFKDGERQTGCFVLKPESDPAARAALETYAQETENETLEADLFDWLSAIREGETDG